MKQYDYESHDYSIDTVRKKSFAAMAITSDDELNKLLSKPDEIIEDDDSGNKTILESGYEYEDRGSVSFKNTRVKAEEVKPDVPDKIFSDGESNDIIKDANDEKIIDDEEVEVEGPIESEEPDSPSTEKILAEAVLTTKQRKRLKDEQFGLPRLRKYPLNDRKHVNMAIRFFNYVKNEKDRKTLSAAIVKRYHELNMTTKVGPNNKLYKYIPDDMKQKVMNESSISFGNKKKTTIRKKEVKINDKDFVPVYIVLTSNPTVVGAVIRTVTGAPYNHASITMDPYLDSMYSFASKEKELKGGMVIESLSGGALAKLSEQGSTYCMYVTFISKPKYERLEQKLKDMIDNINKYTYNFAGLIKYLMHVKSVDEYQKFCSQFVAELLKEADDSLIKKDPSLLAPVELITPKFYKVSEGSLKDYDPKDTVKKVNKLIKSQYIIYYMTENAVFYNNLFYNKNFAKELAIAKGYKLFDKFCPSFKMDIPVRMATSLGGILYEVLENPPKTMEDLEIFVDINYNKEYNKYKVENRDVDHIKYCIELYKLYARIINSPGEYKDTAPTEEEQTIINDWYIMVTYHYAVKNEYEPDSDEYKIQCQYLHELLWEPEDSPFDNVVISDNILAFAGLLSIIDNINENTDILNPEDVYIYMLNKVDISEDIYLLPDKGLYPILTPQSVRMAVEIIKDVDEEDRAMFSKRLNEKYFLFGCKFKLPMNHPYAKYAAARMLDTRIVLDSEQLKPISELNESVIFDEKDLYLNFDKWKKEKGKNVLFITGLSGSGKSTLAEKFESKYKAEMFELDGFEGNYDSSKSDFLKKYKELHPELGKLLDSKEFLKLSNKEKFEEYKKFFTYLIREMKSDPDKLYIVEGIQIYYLEPMCIKNEPVIIKGSSVLTSFIQRIKRESKDGKFNYKLLIDEIFKYRLEMPIWLYKDEKILASMRKQLNESWLINESGIGHKLYHLSESDLDGKTLSPRIPDNYMTKNGFEEGKTARISFSTSIDGCLIGMSQNLAGKELYVYEPEDYSILKTKNITNSQVPDASLTGEVWVLNKTKLKAVAKIKVVEAIEPPLKYKYGEHEAETYKWKWEHLETINEAVNIKEVVKAYNFDLDDDGNIMISKKENANFEDHYNKSLKLLKIYKSGNNITGIKNELCRLYYMAAVIEQYYMDFNNKDIDKDLRKEMIDLRALILNTFSFYLKAVLKEDSHFDFKSYFDKSKYGETLKIKRTAIEGFIKLSKSIISALGI